MATSLSISLSPPSPALQQCSRQYHARRAMPFLSPLAGDDADDYYYAYDSGFRRGSGGGKIAKKDKDKGFLSFLPCFLPCCNRSFPILALRILDSAPGSVEPTAHRRLLSSDSSDSDNIATADITADLARLRARYSRLATGPPVRPRDVPCLLARTDDPPLAVAALSWLGGDLRPSCILLTFLPALFPTLPAHARHALSAAARRLHAREAALDGEVAEYQSTYAMKLACEKTKDGVAETAGEEMCKMARAARRADKLRWRAVEAAVKEVLTPAQAKEFLKAVEDVAARAARHGARWHARTGAVSVPVEVFDRMRANARAATDDAW
uniref:DOG1 domain-containing protein n=1 Tax=Oryza meridionalis TaxID=40149 RepID=A0A0E0EPI3_9ORYZ